jgi:hypothetical protein
MALTMRVSAQADFAQLKREMRGLNNEFSSFKTNVAKGFGQGFLTSSQSRTMEYAQRQMANSIRNLNTLLDEQESKIKQLNNTKITSNAQNKKIKDEIDMRRRNIDTIQAEIRAIEDRQKALNEQAKALNVIQDSHDKTADENSLAGKAKGAASTIGSIVSKVLGIAGIAGAASFVGQAIDYSTERHKMAATLGSRFGAQSRGEFDTVLSSMRDLGLPMGYNGLETMQQMAQFSERGGRITNTDLEGLQLFARGKGADIGSVLGAFSELKRFGGSQLGKQTEFAGMISKSITDSGMQERSVEALETLTGLVGDIAKDMPEVNVGGIAALQTILAGTGLEALKGERGGEIISSLNKAIKGETGQAQEFFSLQALGWGKDLDYYGAKMKAAEGATPENLGRYMQFVRGQGYDTKTQNMMLSNLTGMSLPNAALLNEKVGSQLTTENIKRVQADLEAGGTSNLMTEGGNYMKSYGAYINRTDAELNETMAKVGESLMFVAYAIKDGFDRLLGTGITSIGDVTKLPGVVAGNGGTFTQALGAITEGFGLTNKDEKGNMTFTEKAKKWGAGLGVTGILGGAAGKTLGAPVAGGIAVGAGVLTLGTMLVDNLAKKFGYSGIGEVINKARGLDAQEKAAKAQTDAAETTTEEAVKTRENAEQTNSSFLDGFQKFLDEAKKGFGGTVYGATLPGQATGTFHELTTPLKYGQLFNEAGKAKGVDPTLLAALAQQESGFNPLAQSSAGALGMMQIMPFNLPGLGISDWKDPTQNVYGGADMMAGLLKQYNGDPKLAIAAYNAGAGNVNKWIEQAGTTDWGKVRNFAFDETKNHVVKVMANWQQLSGDDSVAKMAAIYGGGLPGSKLTASAPSAGRMTLDVNVNLSGVSPENEGSIKEIVKQTFDQLLQTQQLRTFTAPYAFR